MHRRGKFAMKKNGIALAIILSVVICLLACLFTACGTTINLGTDITITFMVDGEVYHEMEVKNDKTVRMPAEPEKDGYVFAGWYLSEDYEEVFTSSYLRNNTVVSDITVYAKWVTDDNPPPQGTFTIHFNSMGGSEVADIVLSEGATFVLPDDPTKTGYTFAGWYLDESYQTIFESTSQLIDGIVLYAKWVEEHEHSYTTTTFAPDCENDGYTKYYCECGYYYFDEQVPATGHTPSEWIVDTEPNCLDVGSKHKECTVCNNTIETEVIPATGHTWAWIVDKNATVTESGLKHEECSICHAKQNENTVIDPLDCSHEGTLIHHTKVDATCTEDGTIEYWHCTACDKKYTDAAGQILAESLIIPSAGGHNPTDWIIDSEATCTVNGSKHKECTVCHNTIETEAIPAAHDYEDVRTDPTCTEQGYTIHHCEVCGYSYADSYVDAKGHSPIVDPAVAATCTRTGLTEGSHCVACGTIIIPQEIIPASGHKPTDWIIDKEATDTEDGSKHKECSECHVVLETEVIPATGENLVYVSEIFYYYNGTGVDLETWIRLTTAGNWIEDSGNVGEYQIIDGNLTLILDGEQFAVGTITEDTIVITVEGQMLIYKTKDSVGGGQQGSGDVDETAKITGILGGTVEGFVVSLDVAPTVNDVDLSGMITVSEDSSWQLYADKTGQTLIPTKMAADLKDGENLYYIVVNSGDGKVNRLYTLSIYRNFYTNVYFVNEQEIVLDTIIGVLSHTYLEEHAPIFHEGYTYSDFGCDGWYVNEKNKKFCAGVTTPHEYKVTLDPGEGSVLADHTYVTFDADFTLEIPVRTGYSFVGWYDGETQITDATGNSCNVYQYVGDKTFTAEWQINQYEITLQSSNDAMGIVDGDGSYDYNSTVTITAETMVGHMFLGWYDGNNRLTTSLVYEFVVPAENKTFTAKWMINPITLEKNMDDAGTVSMPSTTIIGKETTITAATNPGYTWLGWYDGDTKVSEGTNRSYTFTMPAENKTYTAKWSKVTLATTPTGVGSISSLTGQYNVGDEVTVTATTSPGYTWLGWYNGNTKVSEGTNRSYTFTMSAENKTYTAKWSKVTLATTPSGAGSVTSLTGRYNVGDEAAVTATTRPGYTWLGWYDGNNRLTTSLVYEFVVPAENKTFTAKWMINPITLEKNIDGAGTVSMPSTTIIGEETTITATTNPGYTWLGWYDGDTKVSEDTSLTYTFTMSAESKTYTAKWAYYTVSTETNLEEAGTYTVKTEEKVAVGETVELTATTNPGYTWLGWYDGDALVCEDTTYTFTMSAENKTYTAKWACYTVSTDTNLERAGSYTRYTEKKVAAGETVELTATTRLGYTWLGWFDGDTKVSDDTSYTFTMSAGSKIYTAKWEISAEMQNFEFTSTSTTCTITDIKDNTITSIVVPDYVTEISAGAFSGCSSLESITIPFVGAKAGVTSDDTYQYPFGYIFGESEYTGGTAVGQYYYGSSTTSATYSTFYIPSSLRSVTVTGNNILYGAFMYCSMLTSITIGDDVTSIGEDAFVGCYRLIEVYNKSNLNIVAGSTDNGYVAKHALNVYTEEDGSKLSTDEDGYIIYTDGDDKILVGYVGNETELTIPDDITAINQYAFCGCNSLTSIVIPDSVTTIGYEAFSGCTSLTSVTFGENSQMTSIGWFAFAGCTGLTSITIPDSVTRIGNEAFYNCDSLTSVIFEDAEGWYVGKTQITLDDASSNAEYLVSTYVAAQWVKVDENGFLVSNYGTLIGYMGTATEITIPDGVTSIGDQAFCDCDSLASIVIPDSVEEIEINAFTNCTGLTSVTFGENSQMTSIGWFAFAGCTGLTSITIPDSVTSIGKGAFSGCSSLESITIPFVGAKAGVTSDDTYQYPFGYIFGPPSDSSDETEVKQYFYGDSTTSTKYDWYGIPSSLRSVTVTGGNILYGAFYNCSMLTSITILDSVTSIGSHAFYNCTGLTNIVIPNSVTSIGDDAFYNCNSLTGITIPDSVTSIGEYAFSGCVRLVEVYNKSGLNIVAGSEDNGRVAYYALSVYTEDYVSKVSTDEDGYIIYTDGDDKILVGYVGDETELIIPDTITEIKAYAFDGCTSLTSITIPDGVTSMGSYAFFDCRGLESVTFGENSQLTSISDRAFFDCVNLYSIIIPASVTTIGAFAFYNCSDLTSITFGENSQLTVICGAAFENCNSLTSVIIPASVTSIGEYAFFDCGALGTVTFEDTTTWYACTDEVDEIEIDVTNASTNATYLKETYVNYYWYKL